MNYRIVNDLNRIQSEEVLRLLKMTYWANNRSIEQIEVSMSNSHCYGVFLDSSDKLVGFAKSVGAL